MRNTLGIDLASQSKNTAVCEIAWGDGAAHVRLLRRGGWNDQALIEAVAKADRVAIDAPFGWPEPFVQALTALPWPSAPDQPRAPFERRRTDVLVHKATGKVPLSVSTDRIAYCAMRCAVIIGAAARDGSGKVVEAYPDASLRRWLPHLWPGASYKRPTGRDRRGLILNALLEALGPGFDVGSYEQPCVDSDDCLDALVCALVARAADRGETVLPQAAEDRRLAAVEGWIHLPHAGSLVRLKSREHP